MKNLWSLLRGDEQPFERMYEERSRSWETPYEQREHYHELAHLHRRLTFISRMILILTLVMMVGLLGDTLRAIALILVTAS